MSHQSPQYRSKSRVLGPCFSCGGYGHLASSCGAKEHLYPLYNPLCQPLVSSAIDMFECLSTCVVWDDSLAAGSAKYKECVDNLATGPAMYMHRMC